MNIELDADMLRQALKVGAGDALEGVRLALRRAAHSGPRFKPARNKAVQWLRDALANGPMLSSDVLKASAEAGVSLSSLRRAKARAGVECYRVGFGSAGIWYWRAVAKK